MSKKLDVPIATLRLNLLESHREHCPWKNADVQSNSKDSPIANMAAWQTLEFMLLGERKAAPPAATPSTPTRGHNRNLDSVDAWSESGLTYPRGSVESERIAKDDDEETEGLQNKWKKLKAKLKRTASKKSLKSVRSGKSGKSVYEKEK